MAFTESTLGGSQGGYHRIRIQVDLLGQEIVNNRSLCRFTAWIERVNSTSYTYNYNPTPGATWRDNVYQARTINGYYSDTAGQRWYLAQNEDHWVGHDGNGNANPFYRAEWDGQNSPYLTSGWVQFNVALPNINRFPEITSFSLGSQNDVQFTASVTTDYTCNLLQYSLNGANWVTGYSGDFTSRSINITGLQSNTQYSLRVRVRRADTGFYDESNTEFITTSRVAFMLPADGL